MGFFSIAIDPLLHYLHRRLQGIVICSLPGVLQHDGTTSALREERYRVYGLADDVKPAVTSLEEFYIVDQGARLFEQSSGNKLHRQTGERGKCAVLALGKWRRTLKQEHIGFPYLQLADSLAMVGVVLTPTWQLTRKINCEEVVSRVKNTIGAWKAGKFMPLVSRPFSLNTYALSKAYFRLGSVDLRNDDIKSIASACKSYCYADMLLKPSEVLLYRSVEEGGLGLQNIQCRAQAALITTFLQTAINPRFQPSLYHQWLYNYHVDEDRTLPNPGYPPFYKEAFFMIIRKFKKESMENIAHVTMRQWYQYLLGQNVTEREVDAEGRKEVVPCRIERKLPDVLWGEIYRVSRLKGLCPEEKSFSLKLIHELLPVKKRVKEIIPTTVPTCWCDDGLDESLLHAFYECPKNAEAATALLRLVKVYDKDMTPIKSLRLEFRVEEIYTLTVATMLVTGLHYIWKQRLQK